MLGRRGHSKDHRPELMQMVLGVYVGKHYLAAQRGG